MRPRDMLKCCYQAAFGAEHLLGDKAAARAYLLDELTACPADRALPLLEALSPDTCRLNLSSWKALGLPEGWLAECFTRSCAPRAAGEERFWAYLESADALAAAGELSFSWDDWQAEKQAYWRDGLRPVHHSDAYRAAERPAYRVIDYRYARMLLLLRHINEQKRQIIALDGRCASGKTTLASDLTDICGASAIHMDDFFLPMEMRTEARLRSPGGNVHHERFMADVLPGLQNGGDFSYPVFDCGVMALNGERRVKSSSVYIVEGAYSCHPALGDYMTLKAFSDIDAPEQQRRILARNGKAGLESFNARWIPLEESYFAAFSIREKADVILPAQALSGDM
ncbi:MAG: hypothetical protein IJ157_00600 [Clostridia bacterium]|nr:hypothetical protein [Clostridia bacterium]